MEKLFISELSSGLDAMEQNPSIYEENRFSERNDALDSLEFQILDQIEELRSKTTKPDLLIQLKYRAQKIKSALQELDANLFQKLRAKISTEDYRGTKFIRLINEYFDMESFHKENQEKIGYDNLDLFINGLLPIQAMPSCSQALVEDMIAYQKTPARIVFELVNKSQCSKEDVFFDLGSGLGQVAILVNLLAGIVVKGVEIEPDYGKVARDCTRALNLKDLTFLDVDARNADYSEGTLFFMFTPFKGDILKEVLEKLRKESLLRKIKIMTYGPCTAEVALQSWLDLACPHKGDSYELAFFSSR
jgi:hypothetical protein